MQKVLLMSILLATIAIPFRNARLEDAELGRRRTIRQMAIFVVCWGIACTYLYWYLPP